MMLTYITHKVNELSGPKLILHPMLFIIFFEPMGKSKTQEKKGRRLQKFLFGFLVFPNNFFFFGRTISAFSHRYEVKRPTKAFRRYLLLRSITLQETESPFSKRFVVTRSIGRFRVPKNLTFKARLSAKELI